MLLTHGYVVVLVVSCFTCGLRCEVADGGGSAALSDVEELVVAACDDLPGALVEEQAASAHGLLVPRALVERLARKIARDHAGDAGLFDANKLVVHHLIQEIGAVACCGLTLCLAAFCLDPLVVVGDCVVQHVVPQVKHVGSSRCFLTRFARVVGVFLSTLNCSIRRCVAQQKRTPHGGCDACAPVVSVRGDWQVGQDLNSHPTDLESATLPIELPT